MKRLRISRGGLELATVPLHRALATIGRSPTCEIVLRAPGVQSIHFLLEWIGTGEFDPATGAWSVFDISASADATGEGVVIGHSPVNFSGFEFRWVEDQLASLPEIGGGIREALEEPAAQGLSRSEHAALLELVQIRADSGAIEQVAHQAPVRLRPSRRCEVRPLAAAPEFRICWEGGADGPFASILLEEMPGVRIVTRGAGASDTKASPGASRAALPVGRQDLIEVLWKDHRFFARLVPRIRVQPAPRVWFKDRLHWKLGALWCLALGVLLGVGFLRHLFIEPEPPAPPPRVAQVEIYKPAPPTQPSEARAGDPGPSEMKAKAKSKSEPNTKLKSEPKASAKNDRAAPQIVQASKSSVVESTIEAPKPVKAPAAVEVSEIGILGALKKVSVGAPAAVRPDLQISEQKGPESISGSEGKIVLRNAPKGGISEGSEPGTPGKGGAGDPTALRGALSGIGSGMVPKSAGPVGREGGSRYSGGGLLSNGVGSGVGGGGADGSGLGGAGAGGNSESGEFLVSGGLDRETVRRVIASYRNQIRACYERGLITHPKLLGRILFEWTISPQGPVSAVQISNSNTGFPSLDACVEDVVRSMKFPAAANGRATVVIYPFVFQVKS